MKIRHPGALILTLVCLLSAASAAYANFPEDWPVEKLVIGPNAYFSSSDNTISYGAYGEPKAVLRLDFNLQQDGTFSVSFGRQSWLVPQDTWFGTLFISMTQDGFSRLVDALKKYHEWTDQISRDGLDVSEKQIASIQLKGDKPPIPIMFVRRPGGYVIEIPAEVARLERNHKNNAAAWEMFRPAAPGVLRPVDIRALEKMLEKSNEVMALVRSRSDEAMAAQAKQKADADKLK